MHYEVKHNHSLKMKIYIYYYYSIKKLNNNILIYKLKQLS